MIAKGHGQNCQIFLSLWGYLVSTKILKNMPTHTVHQKTVTCQNFKTFCLDDETMLFFAPITSALVFFFIPIVFHGGPVTSGFSSLLPQI